MFTKIENIAWVVLILSFLSCVSLAVGIPLGSRWYVLNATRPLEVTIQPGAGNVYHQSPGSSDWRLVTDAAPLPLRSQIRLAEDADAILLYHHPADPEAAIATIQFYGNTEVYLESARTPRFNASELPHAIGCLVRHASNMQPSVLGNGRETQLNLQTPQGKVRMEKGAFKLVVSAQETEITVKTGAAYVLDPASGEMLGLARLQSRELTSAGLSDIYVGERDILRNRNGEFTEPLGSYWTTFTDHAAEDETGGSVSRIQVGEEYVVQFARFGFEHAKTGISQVLDQDIRGVASLRVRARLRVDSQTLGSCGTVGSECPLMLRLYYIDGKTGARQEWLQGFYAVEGPDEPFCQVCGWRALHKQVPQLIWYDYESPDLLPLIQAQGFDPTVLDSIDVYASGHTYGAAIDEVAILVGE